MRVIILPDPLVWQAGTEYGLEALAALGTTVEFVGLVATEGPLLEAVAFAVYQLGLGDKLSFTKKLRVWPRRGHIALLPRVAELPTSASIRLTERVSRRANYVITSEPGILGDGGRVLTAPRRDPKALAELIRIVK